MNHLLTHQLLNTPKALFDWISGYRLGRAHHATGFYFIFQDSSLIATISENIGTNKVYHSQP